MLHEFAIDPSVVSSRDAIRHVFDTFSLDKGRLISRYPKKWLGMTAVPDGRDSAYLNVRWEEAKRNGSIYQCSREFEQSKAWLSNAFDSHRKKPFKAIISTANGPDVYSREDVDEQSEPLCAVKTSYDICRSGDDLADCLSGLLKFSNEIIFIDPYCQFDSRHCQPLLKFLNYAVQEKPPIRIEYHAEYKRASKEHIEQCLRNLNLSLPCPFYFIRWQAKPNAPQDARLHDRGIVTNLAAVSSDGGLDVGAGNTPLKLLGEDSFQRLRRQYCASGDAFEFVDGWRVLGGCVNEVELVDGVWQSR